MSIAWFYSEARQDLSGTSFGRRATGWFYTSPRFLVTAAHFAKALPVKQWVKAEMRQEGSPIGYSKEVDLRVIRMGRELNTTAMTDDIAILELREAFADAAPLDIELEPAQVGQEVLSVGFPRGELRVATGIVRGADSGSKNSGLMLLEVHGANRLLLDAGASGAPVIDCGSGRVTGVLTGLLTSKPIAFVGPVPTPWGSPTNTAVPASAVAAIYE